MPELVSEVIKDCIAGDYSIRFRLEPGAPGEPEFPAWVNAEYQIRPQHVDWLDNRQLYDLIHAYKDNHGL